VHLGDELIHAGQLLRRCLDDQVDAVADDVELGVGDEDRDLDECIFF